MTFEKLAVSAAASARSGSEWTGNATNLPGLFGRRWLRGILAAIVTSLVLISGAQPAMAAVVVQPGEPGHTCGDYFLITSTLKYQLCTWASANGSQSRIWFTAHFSNRGNSTAYIYYIDIGYRRNGSSLLRCRNQTVEQNELPVPAHGVAASTDDCWIPRVPGAYQADVFVVDGSYNATNFSPTLTVR